MQKYTASPGTRPFFKYTSPETTLAILRSKSVRYSSPLSFNDPFDVQSGLHFDFDLNTFQIKVIDRLHELASGDKEPLVDPEDIWGKVTLAARADYLSGEFSRQHWEDMTRPSLSRLTNVIAGTQKLYQDYWRNVLLPRFRVLCVSEEKDHLLMWAHYARDHTGCVLELWSLPEEDNLLSVAEPVEYSNTPPPFFTSKEWVDDYVGTTKLDTDALFHRYAKVKSNHWLYEREWRVWGTFSKSTAPYEDVPVRPSELRALYIGCRALPSFAAEAIALLRQSFPMTRVYRTIKRQDAYGLQYVEV